ncbi:YhfZ family protein [Pseudalkalibacillus sp. R45]|uniref:YhfZ family protein n=1 Tax=Pseudalkalibacillus sp. R45 TaxID=3457433 RepID=UPI003FCEC1D6
MKYNIGERIPTTPVLAEKFTAGYGTIDKAMTALKEMEAIKVQPKGQMGTYLLEKDTALLWSIMDRGPVKGSLPIPSTLEFQGLASGIARTLKSKNIAYTFSFNNGSSKRINELLNHQCDFILLSHQAADLAQQKWANLEIIKTFDEKSYYEDMIVLCNSTAVKEVEEWRIGVDNTSLDHITFSDRVFPQNTKEEVMYMHIPYLIADGVIDAAVWHSSQLVPTKLIHTLTYYPVQYEENNSEVKNMAGAIMVNTDRKENYAFLSEMFNNDKILKIQKEVMTRIITPYY